MIHIHRSKYRALASTLCCLNKFRQCARCFFQCILPALLPQEIYQVLITQLCVRKTIQHIPKGMEKLHWFLWPSFYNFGLQNIFLQWILWWNIMKSHIKKKKIPPLHHKLCLLLSHKQRFFLIFPIHTIHVISLF